LTRAECIRERKHLREKAFERGKKGKAHGHEVTRLARVETSPQGIAEGNPANPTHLKSNQLYFS